LDRGDLQEVVADDPDMRTGAPLEGPNMVT